MADSWETIFDGAIGGRTVRIEKYDEGGYHVLTTQDKDDMGSTHGDESLIATILPTDCGRQICIDGGTTSELYAGLVSNGFSERSASEIVGKIPA